LSGQATFSEEIAGAQYAQGRFFAFIGYDRESHVAFLPFSVLPTFRLSIYSSAAFWKASLTGESSPFLKLDRWIIMINATPLFMSIQT